MAIITGGIIEEWGEPKRALRDVMQEVHLFKPPQLDGEYAVDVAFRSWDPRKTPEFTGVRAGMVGRKQRRFIVWHSVPNQRKEAFVKRPGEISGDGAAMAVTWGFATG